MCHRTEQYRLYMLAMRPPWLLKVLRHVVPPYGSLLLSQSLLRVCNELLNRFFPLLSVSDMKH